jgi:hypothetical protein
MDQYCDATTVTKSLIVGYRVDVLIDMLSKSPIIAEHNEKEYHRRLEINALWCIKEWNTQKRH